MEAASASLQFELAAYLRDQVTGSELLLGTTDLGEYARLVIPDTYDLVSLLRDSYVDLTPQQVDELIAFFLALKGSSTPDAEFRRRFDLMALQRNLKALGTFGYMTTARNNTVYIQYMPRTLRYARENLVKYPRFARLRELLATHLDEFR